MENNYCLQAMRAIQIESFCLVLRYSADKRRNDETEEKGRETELVQLRQFPIFFLLVHR
jgi:hypothetical protein